MRHLQRTIFRKSIRYLQFSNYYGKCATPRVFILLSLTVSNGKGQSKRSAPPHEGSILLLALIHFGHVARDDDTRAQPGSSIIERLWMMGKRGQETCFFLQVAVVTNKNINRLLNTQKNSIETGDSIN